jgi:NADH pyrophosphatase NudC (nudix superfamily)
MELAALFLLLAVALLVGLYVTIPFFSRVRAVRGVNQAASTLMAERDRVLAALQELDFDRTLGKVSEEEYPVQREALLKRGADILRQLDELQTAKAAAEPARKPAPKSETKMAVSASASDDDLEDLIAARRAARKEKTGGFCPQCGTPVLLSDRFCPKCGHSLK